MQVRMEFCRRLLAECQRRSQFKYPDKSYFKDVSATQVKEELQQHKNVFLELATFPMYDEADAYLALRRVLADGVPPDALVENDHRIFQKGLWANLASEPDLVPALPDWLAVSVNDFLGMMQRIRSGWTPPIQSPHTPEWDGSVLVFAAKWYRDPTVQGALRLLRKRWRITPRTNSDNWYLRMNEADLQAEMAQERSASWDEDKKMMVLRRNDPRSASTYSDSELGLVGLPIADYLKDIRTLAWLLGGNRDSDVWARWAEGLLWDFKRLPLTIATHERKRLGRWQGYPNPYPTLHGRLLSPPIFSQPVLRTENGQFSFTFDSKYLALDGISGEHRRLVLGAACRIWGDYEEPWGIGNIERNLKASLKPFNRDEVHAIPLAEAIADGKAHDKKEMAAARQRRHRAHKRASGKT